MTRRTLWLAVAAGLLLFGLANAHLVYVALKSQQPCVTAVSNATADGAKLRYTPADRACGPTDQRGSG